MPWSELLTAVALVFVIEGLLPFVAPNRYKQLVAQIVSLPEGSLRMFGLAAISVGVVLLTILRIVG
ncbi:MAG: DUF2065 family protein [Pseudomonadota bacterium]